jgi:endonuclease/exonuclease/phosphatase family metal-dependent hydrolase
VIGAVNVTGPADVALVAVWACFSGGVKINPVIEAIDAWGEWLAGKAVVVTGDFNSGHFWDDKPTVTGGDHRPLVAALERIGLRPVCCTPGADGPTSHWHNNGKGYHIDHLFIPAGWCGTEWSVGESDPWRTWSDHAPLLVTTGPADG